MDIDKSYRAALYVHIPYCRQKCDYCDFYSSCDLSTSSSLLARIPKQVEELSRHYSINGFSSIYLGGGTPGLVDSGDIDSLLTILRSQHGAAQAEEITIECNPENITPGNLSSWRASGINRISLGIQSFNDENLKMAGRKSSRKAILRALELISEYRESLDLNIDLIQGLPGMSESSQLDDMREAISWKPDHISWYSLILEEGTPLEARWSPPDRLHSDNEMTWLRGCSLLEKNGYRRYEVSNFARKGKESVHNSSYWLMKPYLGCGPAAVSMLRDGEGRVKRFKTRADVSSYVSGLIEYEDVEEIAASDFLKDYLLMGLRLARGIDCRLFSEIFGIELEMVLSKSLATWMDRDCLVRDKEILRCTVKGMDLLNSILISFFDEIDTVKSIVSVNWPPLSHVD